MDVEITNYVPSFSQNLWSSGDHVSRLQKLKDSFVILKPTSLSLGQSCGLYCVNFNCVVCEL